jgi:hypothetical protein
MNTPPSFSFSGNKDRALSLKSEAHQFCRFVENQAEVGGISTFNRARLLEDGSTITVTTKKENNYNIRTSSINIVGAGSLPINEDIQVFSTYMDINGGLGLYPDDSLPPYQEFKSRFLYGREIVPEKRDDHFAGNRYWFNNKYCISWKTVQEGAFGNIVYIKGRFAPIGNGNNAILHASTNNSTINTMEIDVITSILSLNTYKITSKSTNTFTAIRTYNSPIRTITTSLVTLFNNPKLTNGGFLEDGNSLVANVDGITAKYIMNGSSYYSIPLHIDTVLERWALFIDRGRVDILVYGPGVFYFLILKDTVTIPSTLDPIPISTILFMSSKSDTIVYMYSLDGGISNLTYVKNKGVVTVLNPGPFPPPPPLTLYFYWNNDHPYCFNGKILVVCNYSSSGSDIRPFTYILDVSTSQEVLLDYRVDFDLLNPNNPNRYAMNPLSVTSK